MSCIVDFGNGWTVDFEKTRLLLKVAKREHLDSLRMGKIYMKPVGFHRKNEENFPGLGIGDADEGVLTKIQNAEVFMDGERIAAEIDAVVRMNESNPVFCCMSVNFQKTSDDTIEFKPDEQMIKDFVQGDPKDYGVLVFEQTAFLERVFKACSDQGIQGIYRDVIYTDDATARIRYENGIILTAPFFKKTKLCYQNEFRILFSNMIKDYFVLDIGDISDISRGYSVEMLKHGIIIRAKSV